MTTKKETEPTLNNTLRQITPHILAFGISPLSLRMLTKQVREPGYPALDKSALSKTLRGIENRHMKIEQLDAICDILDLDIIIKAR